LAKEGKKGPKNILKRVHSIIQRKKRRLVDEGKREGGKKPFSGGRELHKNIVYKTTEGKKGRPGPAKRGRPPPQKRRRTFIPQKKNPGLFVEQL